MPAVKFSAKKGTPVSAKISAKKGLTKNSSQKSSEKRPSARVLSKAKNIQKQIHANYMGIMASYGIKLTGQDKKIVEEKNVDILANASQKKRTSPYHQFQSEQHTELAPTHKELADRNKIINQRWRKLGKEGQTNYSIKHGFEEKGKRKPTEYNKFMSEHYDTIASKSKFKDLIGKEKNTAIFTETAQKWSEKKSNVKSAVKESAAKKSATEESDDEESDNEESADEEKTADSSSDTDESDEESDMHIKPKRS